MRILNMTQHSPTEEQSAAGVVQPEPADHEKIKQIITFDELPSLSELKARAKQFAEIAGELIKKYGCSAVLIGGAPYFSSEQERALWEQGIRFCYAFSKRVAEERVNADGSVTKVMQFKHAGFIWKEAQ